MAERKTAKVELLARDALNKVPRPYGEDVILDVFRVIEHDAALLGRYRELKAELRPHVVNAWVGRHTKELADMETITEVSTHDSRLIASYSKLSPKN